MTRLSKQMRWLKFETAGWAKARLRRAHNVSANQSGGRADFYHRARIHAPRRLPPAPGASRSLRRAPAELGQQLLDFGRGPSRAEQEALHLVAAFRAQPIELIHGFHPFGVRGDVETPAKPGDRPYDSNPIGSLRKILHKRAVDLDLVERKASEIAEAGISGAEIVHRNTYAEFAQLMQDRKIGLGLRQEERFGNFQLEPRWRQSGLRQRRDHPL